MENKENKQLKLQQKYRETLLRLLNNIGIVGAVLTAIVDLVCVIIFVVGIKIEIKGNSAIIFSIVSSLVGIMINFFLRYQGQKYAEIENQEILNKFYRKKIKEVKKPISMNTWLLLNTIKDILLKGVTISLSIFGIIYISIDGSKNPVQILITIATLVLFTCFGLISMNSAYCRFYNKQLPYMEEQIKQKEVEENGTN